jgi:hypothetical protein
VSEIISEWWAISFRNRGRFKIGMVGDFARNQHAILRGEETSCYELRGAHPAAW